MSIALSNLQASLEAKPRLVNTAVATMSTYILCAPQIAVITVVAQSAISSIHVHAFIISACSFNILAYRMGVLFYFR